MLHFTTYVDVVTCSFRGIECFLISKSIGGDKRLQFGVKMTRIAISALPLAVPASCVVSPL